MTLTALFLVWLQMSAQAQINAQDFKMADCNQPGMTCTIADGWKSLAPPAAPPVGHFECWRDAATGHFSCASPKGSILDVESALANLDERLDETKWGGKANGSCLIPSGPLMQIVNQPTALDDITRAEFAEAAQRAADETDGKPPYQERVWCTAQTGCVNAKGEQVTPPHGLCPFGMECPAEPVDVPAVQVSDEACENKPAMAGRDGHSIECSPEGKRYTCDPKSRILEHDENSPPKYWCRKVQP